MPTFGSLFAGIGGFDLGLERAGWECRWQVEIDPFCQRVLARRWPGVQRWDDVRSVAREPQRVDDASRSHEGSAGRCEPLLPIDLLVGGFPCQDLSVAGKRAGLSGERSGLFWDIVRIAKATRPTWGLFENVPGLLSSSGGRDMGLVLAGLRECWPAVGYRVLDSRYFGVAQRRRRVFFVCGPTEDGVASVLFEPAGGGGDSAARGEAWAGVAASLTAGSHRPGVNEPGRRNEDDVNLVAVPDVAWALQERDAKGVDSDTKDGHLVVSALKAARGGPDDNEARANRLVIGTLREHTRPGSNTDYCVTHPLKAEGHDASEDGKGRGVPMIPVTFKGNMSTPAWGEDVSETLQAENFSAVAFDTTQITSDKNYSNPQPGDPCHPLAAGAHAPAVASLMAVRRLTPTECERLQGFPDGWTCLCDGECSCPDSPRYRALGNAVTVNVIEWIGRRLMAAL